MEEPLAALEEVDWKNNSTSCAHGPEGETTGYARAGVEVVQPVAAGAMHTTCRTYPYFR
jgi:hypothetical protein